MAALTITASNVKLISGDNPAIRKLATAVTAGQLVYVDPETLLAHVASPASALTSGSNAIYVALANGALDQWVTLAKPDSIIDLGAGIQGQFYYLGANGTLDNSTPGEDNFATIAGFINEDGNFVFKPVVSSTPFVA